MFDGLSNNRVQWKAQADIYDEKMKALEELNKPQENDVGGKKGNQLYHKCFGTNPWVVHLD